MPDGVEVELIGGRELRRTMKEAGEDLGQLKAANLQVAGIVSRASNSGAPRRTGRLAASTRPGATQKAAVIRTGNARTRYANPIHWGWGRRNIAANPWSSRAGRTTETQWTAVYRMNVMRIINRVRGA